MESMIDTQELKIRVAANFLYVFPLFISAFLKRQVIPPFLLMMTAGANFTHAVLIFDPFKSKESDEVWHSALKSVLGFIYDHSNGEAPLERYEFVTSYLLHISIAVSIFRATNLSLDIICFFELAFGQISAIVLFTSPYDFTSFNVMLGFAFMINFLSWGYDFLKRSSFAWRRLILVFAGGTVGICGVFYRSNSQPNSFERNATIAEALFPVSCGVLLLAANKVPRSPSKIIKLYKWLQRKLI